MKIGILGNGSVGQRLAALFRAAGHQVLFGLRSPPAEQSGDGPLLVSLADAAAQSELLVIALPYAACAEVLPPLRAALAGKVVVDATNPVNSDWSPLSLGAENSAGEEIARLLPGSSVVKAFNTIFADVMTAERLNRGGLPTTVFLCGSDAVAKQQVAALAAAVGMAPLDAGPLSSARFVEAIAHLNIRLAVGLGGGTNAAFLYHRPAS